MNALTLPGTTESLLQVTRYVLDAAAQARLDERTTYHLRLAVDEIATNIVTHGYAEAGLTGSLTISTAVNERELTIYLDDIVIDRFRALSEKTGKGYQTLVNEALRAHLGVDEAPLTAAALRRILREELAQHG